MQLISAKNSLCQLTALVGIMNYAVLKAKSQSSGGHYEGFVGDVDKTGTIIFFVFGFILSIIIFVFIVRYCYNMNKNKENPPTGPPVAILLQENDAPIILREDRSGYFDRHKHHSFNKNQNTDTLLVSPSPYFEEPDKFITDDEAEYTEPGTSNSSSDTPHTNRISNHLDITPRGLKYDDMEKHRGTPNHGPNFQPHYRNDCPSSFMSL
eukprot:Tbor_TRINITY_DN289_c0_g1::TRINITY_DN289_c0_g1_i1::g.12221::m.12221